MILFYYKAEQTARIQELPESRKSYIPDLEGVTIETTDRRVLLKDIVSNETVADLNIDNYDIYYFEGK